MKIRSAAIAIVMMAFFIGSAKAYTVFNRPFPGPSTTYKMENSYSSQGTGWNNMANGAAADWNGATNVWSYLFSNGSPNKIRAAQDPSNPNQLGVTNATIVGIYRNTFSIDVNTCCGHAFYDGTQAPSLPGNYYDLRTLMRHEFGHGFGLGHSSANGLLMYHQQPPGVERFVDNDASNGARWLFDPNHVATHPEGVNGLQAISGQGNHDNTSTSVGFAGPNWSNGTGCCPLAYLQGLYWTNQKRAKAFLQFNGSRVTYRATKHWNRGRFAVYIDSAFQGNFDYDLDGNTAWRVDKTFDLAGGNHFIEVVNLGDPAPDEYIDNDAFVVDIYRLGAGSYDDSDLNNTTYLGNWTHSDCCASAHNSTISWSNTTNDAYTFTFLGNSITWVTTHAYNRGRAIVTIDGVQRDDVDLYASPNQWQVQHQYNGLGNGTHQIHILVKGQKNPASADYYVDLDRFIVN